MAEKAKANDKANNLQDVFLNAVRKQKIPVTMFLVNGVKLQGVITWFDNFSVLLRRDGHSQLVYKHAISTVMPARGGVVPVLDWTTKILIAILFYLYGVRLSPQLRKIAASKLYSARNGSAMRNIRQYITASS